MNIEKLFSKENLDLYVESILEELGDWENAEGMSQEALDRLFKKVEEIEKNKKAR